MQELSNEQRKVLEDLKNLCQKALENNSADNVIVAIGNNLIEFADVFMPKEIRGVATLLNPPPNVFVDKEKGDNLEYWEKELDKIDKKEDKDDA